MSAQLFADTAKVCGATPLPAGGLLQWDTPEPQKAPTPSLPLQNQDLITTVGQL